MAGIPPEIRPTLLLVEDDDLLRDLLTEVLEAEDFQVLAAENASIALERIAQTDEPIDLLVTDVVMPGMSGFELAKRVRTRRPRIRVLNMSGYSRELLRNKGVPDPRDGFLWKPFSNDALVKRVNGLLDSA